MLDERANWATFSYLGVTKKIFVCQYVCDNGIDQKCRPSLKKFPSQVFGRKISAVFVNGQNRFHRFKMVNNFNT